MHRVQNKAANIIFRLHSDNFIQTAHDTFTNIVIARSSFTVVFAIALLFATTVITSKTAHSSTTPTYQRLSSIEEKLNSPTSIAINTQGRIHVSNANNDRVLIFSQQGQLLDSIKGMSRPLCITADESGKFYVGNEKKGNVEVFDANFNLLHKLGHRDSEFIQPNDIAVDNITGHVYVADMKKDVVGIYDSDGVFIRNLGEPGNGNGQFNSPVSVAIDENAEEIIVLDRGLIKIGGGMMGSWVPGARVQFFSMSGNFLGSFNRYGNTIGSLVRPQRLDIDNQGRLYITDSFQNIVLIYDKTGNHLGEIYDLENPLRTPLGLSFDQNNKLYIASRAKKRVDVYGIDDFLSIYASPTNLSFSRREGENDIIPQNLSVENNGNKSLSWTATVNDSWISLVDNQGILDIGQSGSFTASIDTTGLQPGDYQGSITVYVNATEMAIINISLNIKPAPVLEVTPLNLIFKSEVGRPPLPQAISLRNIGSLPLNWHRTTDIPWIVVKGAKGFLPGFAEDTSEITVYPSVRNLAPGKYNGTITFTAPNAVLSPVTVNVALILTERGTPPGKGKDKYLDSDNDGIPDVYESCPYDPKKLEPGICGCGYADIDINFNGTIDCLEKKKKRFFPIPTKEGKIIWIVL